MSEKLYREDEDGIFIINASRPSFYMLDNVTVDLYVPAIGLAPLGLYCILKRLSSNNRTFYPGGLKKLSKEVLCVDYGTLRRHLATLETFGLVETLTPTGANRLKHFSMGVIIKDIPEKLPLKLLSGKYQPITDWLMEPYSGVRPVRTPEHYMVAPRSVPGPHSKIEDPKYEKTVYEQLHGKNFGKQQQQSLVEVEISENLENTELQEIEIPPLPPRQNELPKNPKNFSLKNWTQFYSRRLREVSGYYFVPNERDEGIIESMLEVGLPPERLAAGIEIFVSRFETLPGMQKGRVPGVAALRQWWPNVEEIIGKKDAKKKKGWDFL